MKFTAKQIADYLNGRIEGNQDIEVSGISKIEEGKPGTLTFLANPKYEQYIYTTNASIVIVNENFTPEKKIQATLIRVKDAYSSFASLLQLYQDTKLKSTKGISKTAKILKSAKIGKNVFIDEFVYIGDKVKIADNVKIFAHTYIGDNTIIGEESIIRQDVKIYEDCVIGKNCIIHAGVVIGSDGFGFAPGQDNYKKIPQIGNVIIEDFVEIGANTTIDRATIGSTIIRKGVKLDNLIQIAHNVEIGENTVIAAQTGISGSAKIGKNCMIGGQVGIVGHIKIADGVKIAAQSGIGSDITEPNAVYQGSPAFEISKYRRSYVSFKNLPQLVERINNIEKKLP